MRTIITTVGTSLFTNFQKQEVRDLFGHYYNTLTLDGILKEFKPLTANDIYSEKYEDEIEQIKHSIQAWFEKLNGGHPSAEISSCIKIADDTDNGTDEEFRIHLIATDTLLSVLAAELITSWFERNVYGSPRIKEVRFQRQDRDSKNTNSFVIPKLSVRSQSEYEEGVITYIGEIDKIYKTNEKCILNITGGYKALIPITILYGQVKNIQTKYLFNDEEVNDSNLITVPDLPFSYDSSVAELYVDYLHKNILTELSYKQNHPTLNKEDKNLITKLTDLRLIENQINNKKIKLTSLGEIIKSLGTEQRTDTKSELGYFMELIVFEHYYYNKEKYKHIDRSKMYYWSKDDPSLFLSNKLENQDCNLFTPIEIDIEITTGDNKITWVEVKSFSETGILKAKKQIKTRIDFIKSIKASNKINVNQIILFLYKDISFNYMNKENINKIEDVKSLFTDTQIEFQVFFFEFKTNKKGTPLYKNINGKNIKPEPINKLLIT